MEHESFSLIIYLCLPVAKRRFNSYVYLFVMWWTAYIITLWDFLMTAFCHPMFASLFLEGKGTAALSSQF